MPLKLSEISWLIDPAADPNAGHAELAIRNVYAQKEIPIPLRVLLADWISANGEIWFYISSTMLNAEASVIIASAIEFLRIKLQNNDAAIYRDKGQINNFIIYLGEICAGRPVHSFNVQSDGSSAVIMITPIQFLCSLKHCFLEETSLFETSFSKENIDGVVNNLVACSVVLANRLDDLIVTLRSDSPTVQQQYLWTEVQRQKEYVVMAIRNYTEAQKQVEIKLINCRARFNQQMAWESFGQPCTLDLDQLQAAFDTASQVVMRDLSRLQMGVIFMRHVGDEEMALVLQTTHSDLFSFLCSGIVRNCLVLEKQVPQNVRKSIKFPTNPVLRMLCPSVLFLKPKPSSQHMNMFCITETERVLQLDSMMEHRLAPVMIEQRVPPFQREQPQQLDVEIDVYFLSEVQAQEFVTNLVLPRPELGAHMHSAQLTYEKVTKRCSTLCKGLTLNQFTRGDRAPTHLVTEEKFCLAFNCAIPLQALANQPNAQQTTKVIASVLSLPFVVTVHNNQEASAAIVSLWDNYFAKMNRLPFEVTRKATWAEIKQLLHGRWQAVCGQGLSEGSLQYLAERLFHNSSGNARFSNYDSETVTWSMLVKDLLPCSNSDLPRFTFWEWFHSCLKLMSKETKDKGCLRPFWPNYMIGFASHEQVEDMLKDQPPGTFLLRFSSTETGAIVIPYVKHHKNRNNVERGFGPCTFKDCDPYKVISDLKHLQFFYPTMRRKQDVLQELDEMSRKKKKPAKRHGYEKLEQKTVGASSNSSEESDETMSCDFSVTSESAPRSTALVGPPQMFPTQHSLPVASPTGNSEAIYYYNAHGSDSLPAASVSSISPQFASNINFLETVGAAVLNDNNSL